MTISRVNTFSYLPYAREINVLFHQANVLVILPIEIFWPSLFTKLIFLNISGVIPLYDQSVISWKFRIREIRLRGKYDVVERETRCCWEGNTMFDQCHVGLPRPIEFLYKYNKYYRVEYYYILNKCDTHMQSLCFIYFYKTYCYIFLMFYIFTCFM